MIAYKSSSSIIVFLDFSVLIGKDAGTVIYHLSVAQAYSFGLNILVKRTDAAIVPFRERINERVYLLTNSPTVINERISILVKICPSSPLSIN